MLRPDSRLNLMFLMVLVLSFMPAVAGEALTPYNAEYSIRIGLLRGSLQTRLSMDGNGYRARSEIRPVGLARLFSNGQIVEQSDFRLTETGVRPDAYQSADTLSRDKESVALEFDWNAKEVAGTVGDQPYVAPLDGDINDRVSIQYALAFDLSSGGVRDRYVMFDVDRAKTLEVSRLETTVVDVPFGSFSAVPVVHQARDSSRVTTLWCVAELDYLPVIIEQRKDGKRLAYAVLKSYSAEPAAAATP